MNFATKSTLLILLIGFLCSCENPNQEEINCQQKEFDIDLFVNTVHDRMQEESISGYQFAVNRNSTLYHNEPYGFSRHKDDPGGEIPMTEFTQHNVASVSKFVGAIALMNALEERGIDVDSPLVDRLPPTWTSQVNSAFSDPNHMAFLTFSDLLTNNTAIRWFGDGPPSSGAMLSEADMLASLQQTPDLSRIGEYQNANFTLIRVLIGELIYDLEEQDTANYAVQCSEKYFEYIRETIFDPLEINAPLTPQAVLDYYATPTYPLGYQWPFNPFFMSPDLNEVIGWNHKNNPLNAGSSGLVLSARDLAKLLAAFKYDFPTPIISNNQRDLIFDRELGLTTTFYDVDHGPYYAKNGAKSNDTCCGSRALKSVVVYFPDDVEGVLMTNSKIESIGRLLVDAYDDSYVFPCD